MKKRYEETVVNAVSFKEMFGIVQKFVHEYTGKRKTGIRLYLEDLGYLENGFIGAYYQYHTNAITINASPLRDVLRKNPTVIKWYLFHLLLHEYVHALGVVDERRTREIVYELSVEHFGKKHILTRMAQDLMPYVQPGRVKKNVDVVWDGESAGNEKDFFDSFEEMQQIMNSVMKEFDRMFNHFF